MIFQYSYWLIVPILILSGGVAWFKFRKISKLPDIRFGLALLISFLRFTTVFILLFLLLKPALSLLRNVKEKPLLIVAQDNTASLLNGKDSLYYRNEYSESLKKEITGLSDKFKIEWLTFGQSVKKSDQIDFTGSYTDISGVFDYIDNTYIYQQPSLVLLLSDGVYNTGVNPRYKMTSYPVYTVGLGDTVAYTDVYVRAIECDKFNFVKTIFPVKATVAAVKQNGKNVKCVLRENGNVIGEKIVTIEGDNFVSDVVFDVEAKQKGVVKYTVTLEAGFAERSKENNLATTFIHIMDNSGNISVFYSAPHPDIAAIVGAVGRSGIYNCSAHNLNEPLGEINANLIILHNPDPGNPNYQKIAEIAAKRKISLWFILTTRESIIAFARFGKAYTVSFGNDMNEYVTIAFNRDFPFFEFTEQEINGLTAYPPLILPLGEIKNNAGKPLLTQKIKNTPTSNGMMSFYDDNNIRICYFWGEGLWKWRLYSYRENGNHELFNLLINKTVNYLAAKKGNDRFINDIRPLYDESEETAVNVELYNDSYELVNIPDVNLSLRYGDQNFDYIFSRYGDKYRINLGNLRAGEYSYVLTTNLKGENFEKKGSFYVRNHNQEVNDIVADRQLLHDLAVNSGGKAIEISDLNQLVNNFKEDTFFKAKYKSEVKHIELSEMGALGLLLLLLLCIEWFLLKYFVS